MGRADGTLATPPIYGKYLKHSRLKAHTVIVPLPEATPRFTGIYLSKQTISPAVRQHYAAALKAMTTAHIPVAAAAPISGPYALEAFGDAVFMGYLNRNSTTFIPLLTTGYQKAYGNIYQTPADIYTPNYSWTVETTTPNTNVLFQATPTGNTQLDALSPVNPAYVFGFSSNNYLINTSYRLAYLADMGLHPDGVMSGSNTFPAASPQSTLRQALKTNDLRGMTPTMPVLMCGGGGTQPYSLPIRC